MCVVGLNKTTLHPIIIITVLTTTNMFTFNHNSPVSVSAYFPEIQDDLTKVTWAHAVNSRAKLNASLNDPSMMMIEADILMGYLEGAPAGIGLLPVMGHPPQTTSDLSLEEFLNIVVNSGKRKGVKLDFKSKEVFAGSENVLEEILVRPEADFPIWLNADVVRGPGESQRQPVDADYFVSTVVKKFPTATLSVGWTTRFQDKGSYSEDEVSLMSDVLSRNAVTQPVTFPVRAALAAHSAPILTTLVRSSLPGTTLTIWMSNDTDVIDVDALRHLILDIGKDKVYLDLPATILQQLNLNSNQNGAAAIFTPSKITSAMVAIAIALLLYSIR